MPPRAVALVCRSLAVVALVTLSAGIVIAQPADAPLTPTAPEAPVAEEAPPAVIPAPTPATAAPVTAAEIAPAAAPKEKVAEKIVEIPVRRTRYDVAVLQALDKVTAETQRFEVPVGRPVRWKGLVFTVRACERSAPNEPVGAQNEGSASSRKVICEWPPVGLQVKGQRGMLAALRACSKVL